MLTLKKKNVVFLFGSKQNREIFSFMLILWRFSCQPCFKYAIKAITGINVGSKSKIIHVLKKSLIRRFKSAGEPLVLLAVLAVLLLVPRKIVGDHTRLIWRGELNYCQFGRVAKTSLKHPHQYNVIQFRNSPGASAAAGIIIEQVETLT